MKITIFTSNQPRHISLVEEMASFADSVFVVQECNTVFPGQVQDFFNKTDTMQEYFGHVIAAEKSIFGEPRYLPAKARSLAIKMGDLNKLPISTFDEALQADYFIVFGASYIKGELAEQLVAKRAINIHMGASPYYRGSSCNFWAAYDGNIDMVGSTIHLLSKGLDSGPMLFHSMPSAEKCGAFELGMRAVKAAHHGLSQAIQSGEINKYEPIAQDKTYEIRYTRNRDFDDAVARKYLDMNITAEQVKAAVARRDESKFTNLVVF